MVEIKVTNQPITITYVQSLLDIADKTVEHDRAIVKMLTDSARQEVERAVNRWLYECEGGES